MFKYYVYKALHHLELVSEKKYNQKEQKYGFKTTKEYKAIAKSKLFDAKWYLKQNPDVKASGMDPVLHYLKYGWKERRNPSPNFNTNLFLTKHRDCSINPILYCEYNKILWEAFPIKNQELQLLSTYLEEHQKVKKVKKVIYSCISGNYDHLSKSFVPRYDYDYVLFTDNKSLLKKKKYLWWTIKPLQYNNSDNVRNARWHKLHPHILFPNYRYSVWVDSNIQINGPTIYQLIDNHIELDHKIAISLHPKRDCIYQEAKQCMFDSKDNPLLINKQINLLKQAGYPEHNGLYETNILFRQHRDKKIKALNEEWWTWVLNYSRRDQLSFNYLLWKNKIKHYALDSKSLRFHPELSFVAHHYNPVCTKFSTGKILVHLHLYYVNQLDYFLKRLKNVSSDYDLYITMTQDDSVVEEKIRRFHKNTIILKVPNIGYDIYPFWQVLQNIDLSDYDAVLKIHTKNYRNSVYINNGHSFIGFEWRNALVDSLLKNKKIFKSNITTLQRKGVGAVGCQELIRDPKIQRDENYEKFLKPLLFKKFNIVAHSSPFICGTMFLISSNLLEPFKQMRLHSSDFDVSSKTGKVSSLAHALERYLGILVSQQGRIIVGRSCQNNFVKKIVQKLTVCIESKKNNKTKQVDDAYYKLIKSSQYFDATWYLQQNPDVAKAGMDPVEHYLLFGWKEKRLPSKNFDGNAYLLRNPDVAAANMCPLLHYEKYGKKEQRTWKLPPAKKEFNYKTYSNLYEDIVHNLHKLDASFDLVVGIPRSGMIPAYWIAQLLKIPVLSLDEYLQQTNSPDFRSVLVVDDSVNLGRSLQRTKSNLSKICGVSFKYLAVYAVKESLDKVDYAFVVCPQPRIFEWNYLNHPLCKNWGYDIDGVLCRDPSPEENDDGEKYRTFLLNATPLFIPKYKVKVLATARLEKYRKETETWLKKHGVLYENLYMLDLPNKETRIKQQAHIKMKILALLRKDVDLFIESSKKEASQLYQKVQKAVICTADNVMFSKHNMLGIAKENKSIYNLKIDVLSYLKETNTSFDIIVYDGDKYLLRSYMLGAFAHKMVVPANIFLSNKELVLGDRMQRLSKNEKPKILMLADASSPCKKKYQKAGFSIKMLTKI